MTFSAWLAYHSKDIIIIFGAILIFLVMEPLRTRNIKETEEKMEDLKKMRHSIREKY